MRRSFHSLERNPLTIDFGSLYGNASSSVPSPFKRVKSEMLKRKEKMALRKKPMEYEKLEISLQ